MERPTQLVVVGVLSLVLGVGTAIRAQEAASDMPEGFAPAVADCGDLGQIDWARGVAIVTAQASLEVPTTPENKMKVARMAREKAYARAVRLMGAVRIDANRTIAQLHARDSSICMTGFVQRFPVTHYRQWSVCTRYVYCEATIHVPFYGLKGLSIYMHDHVAKRKVAPRVRRQAWRRQAPCLDPCRCPPIIVVDATGLCLQQAMYPQIMDACGAVLLGLNSRDENVMAHEGMVTYVTRTVPVPVPCMPADPLSQGPDIGQHMRWGTLASRLTGNPTTDLLPRASAVIPGVPNGLLLAAAPARRRRIRRRRIRVRASSAAKTDIVLSAAAAKKLTTNPEAAKALKQGRVYIVVDSRKAAIQGRGPLYRDDRWGGTWRIAAR